MQTFDHAFLVAAPRADVVKFHGDARALRRLMPPPLFVDLHEGGRLEEGAVADFTMWFGPLPVRWRAIHVDVGESGFTDVQLHGPLHRWRHTHRFIPVDGNVTRVEDHVAYEHPTGLRGWLTRLLFNRASLAFLFAYRRYVTRRALSRPEKNRSSLKTSYLRGAVVAALLFVIWRLSQKTAGEADGGDRTA